LRSTFAGIVVALLTGCAAAPTVPAPARVVSYCPAGSSADTEALRRVASALVDEAYFTAAPYETLRPFEDLVQNEVRAPAGGVVGYWSVDRFHDQVPIIDNDVQARHYRIDAVAVSDDGRHVGPLRFVFLGLSEDHRPPVRLWLVASSTDFENVCR